MLHSDARSGDGAESGRRWSTSIATGRRRAWATSLYVRPTIVAIEPFLGVRRPKAVISTSSSSRPVGPYYPEGMEPGEDQGHRQVRARVCGRRWARPKILGQLRLASLYARREAKHRGLHFFQVLWLDGVHSQVHRRSRGTMNIMLKDR